MVLGDWWMGWEMMGFCKSYNFRCLLTRPTFFKNPENPSWLNHVFANSPYSFESRSVIAKGFSYFYKIITVVKKISFQKLQPKREKYRNYKAFSNKVYREDLISKLPNEKLNWETMDKFLGICIDALDQHALCKTKMLHICPYMNKELWKAIFTRARLRNKFFQKWHEENRKLYTQQRNHCVVLLRKTKREFYENINKKDVTDNKTFWKNFNPFLSVKAINQNNITLIDKNFHTTSRNFEYLFYWNCSELKNSRV